MLAAGVFVLTAASTLLTVLDRRHRSPVRCGWPKRWRDPVAGVRFRGNLLVLGDGEGNTAPCKRFRHLPLMGLPQLIMLPKCSSFHALSCLLRRLGKRSFPKTDAAGTCSGASLSLRY